MYPTILATFENIVNYLFSLIMCLFLIINTLIANNSKPTTFTTLLCSCSACHMLEGQGAVLFFLTNITNIAFKNILVGYIIHIILGEYGKIWYLWFFIVESMWLSVTLCSIPVPVSEINHRGYKISDWCGIRISNPQPPWSLIDSKCALHYATCFSRGLFCGCSHLLSDSPKYWGRSRDITTIYEAPPVTHLAVKKQQ